MTTELPESIEALQREAERKANAAEIPLSYEKGHS